MRILATGSGGFVGAHLVPNLLEAGHEVVAASHRPMEAEGCLAIEVFDIRDEETVEKIIATYEPDAVIHLAAQASVRMSWEEPRETYEINLIGTGYLLQSLRERPATRVLLVGSAQIYGPADLDRPLREEVPANPNSPYALTKLAQEHVGRMYAAEFGLPVVIARPFNHTGPGQSTEYAVGSFCSQIVEIERGDHEPLIEVGALDRTRDFLDVRDVVEAYRLLTESGTGGEVYNVCSGKGTRIGDVLEILLEAAALTEVEVIQDPTPRPGDPRVLIGDNSKIRGALGWEPRITLERSLVDALDWYRKRRSQGVKAIGKGESA